MGPGAEVAEKAKTKTTHKRNSDRKRNRKVSSARASGKKSGGKASSGQAHQWTAVHVPEDGASAADLNLGFQVSKSRVKGKGIAKKAKRASHTEETRAAIFRSTISICTRATMTNERATKKIEINTEKGRRTRALPLRSTNRRQRTTAKVPTVAGKTTITISRAEGLDTRHSSATTPQATWRAAAARWMTMNFRSARNSI